MKSVKGQEVNNQTPPPAPIDLSTYSDRPKEEKDWVLPVSFGIVGAGLGLVVGLFAGSPVDTTEDCIVAVGIADDMIDASVELSGTMRELVGAVQAGNQDQQGVLYAQIDYKVEQLSEMEGRFEEYESRCY